MHETFWTLLQDPAHWEFELFVGLVETIIIDVLLIGLGWRVFLKPYVASRQKAVIDREHEIHGLEAHD